MKCDMKTVADLARKHAHEILKIALPTDGPDNLRKLLLTYRISFENTMDKFARDKMKNNT